MYMVNVCMLGVWNFYCSFFIMQVVEKLVEVRFVATAGYQSGHVVTLWYAVTGAKNGFTWNIENLSAPSSVDVLSSWYCKNCDKYIFFAPIISTLFAISSFDIKL